VLVLQAGNCEI